MTKGKVVLVPFPFDDLSAAKVRPAVCLTDPVGPHRHVVLAFVTSQVPPALLESDVVLEPGHPEFPMTGLHARSALRLHRLMTVSTSFIVRDLGFLSPDTQGEVAAVKGERKPLCEAAEAYEDLEVARDYLRLWKGV